MVPVDVVRSGAELRITGLPDDAILLTVGQGFVKDGLRLLISSRANHEPYY